MLNQKLRACSKFALILMMLPAIDLMTGSAGRTLAEEPGVSVRRADSWTNLFAGKPASMRCEISSKQAGEATLSWSLTVLGGVIARGDKPVTLNRNRPVEVSWDVELPAVQPGLIAAAMLRLQVQPQAGSPKFEPAKELVNLSICSPDATVLREEWLKSLDIVLFDPARNLADAFERSHIPCRVADEPQCANLTKGLILYGEGIDPVRLDAVWSSAIEAAAAGRRVLVLASSGAAVPMEGLLASSTDSLQAISLKRNDIIHEFDKRLDATAWPKPGRLVATSLHWTTRGDQPRVEFRDDPAGWTWLDVRHRNGGRLIWLGFGLTESWETTPTARYLMLKVLEDLKTDKPLMEGK